MISLAMIARDEASRLPGCLDSVRDAVDEMVVLDTGSTDDTVEQAKARGARVLHWKWRDSFAAARNECLRHVHGDWVLVLDADERLAADGAAVVRAAVADGDAGGFDCRLVSMLPPGQPAPVIAAWFCRLFRLRPGVQFEGRIHEQVAPSIYATGGVVKPSSITITHLGYAEANAEKLARNLRLLRLELEERPGRGFTLFNLGLTQQAAGDWSAAEDALREALACADVPLARALRPVALTKLAESYLRDGRWSEAAGACERALGEEPNLALARYVLGRACFELGDLDRAAELFSGLLNASPDALGMALYRRLPGLALGLCRLRQQRFADAAATLEPLAAGDPSGETAFQLGNAYLGLGRLAQAAVAYRRARAHGLTTAEVERRLALCDRLVARLEPRPA